MGQILAFSVNEAILRPSSTRSWVRAAAQAGVLIFSILGMFGLLHAQGSIGESTADAAYVVEGTSDTMAYGLGRSLRINGTVREGAISLGGDVIVQGTVEGDVAAIGGSVVQLEGSRIGGDVIVVGGTYRHVDKTPNRSSRTTIMYTGYEQELRNMMRDPSDLLTPRWSPAYIGLRLLALLFWFIVSLALTAAMPGTISRGIARLQLTSLRVAVIGFVGAVVIGVGVPFSLHYLPAPIGLAVGCMALLLIVVAGVFGRVIIYAATGRWLQRKHFPFGKNSESVALLLGTSFWIIISSLPYIWPLAIGVILVTSLGLALTARYRVGWGRRQEV